MTTAAGATRISTDDIGLAATWLEAYEGDETDEDTSDLAAMKRVARWLRAEEARRIAAARERELVAYAMREHGISRAVATIAVRRVTR